MGQASRLELNPVFSGQSLQTSIGPILGETNIGALCGLLNRRVERPGRFNSYSLRQTPQEGLSRALVQRPSSVGDSYSAGR